MLFFAGLIVGMLTMLTFVLLLMVYARHWVKNHDELILKYVTRKFVKGMGKAARDAVSDSRE